MYRSMPPKVLVIGLTATFKDRLYFQDLREAAQVLNDWAMVAYYDYLLRRYEP